MLFGIRLPPFAIGFGTDVEKTVFIFDQGDDIKMEVRHVNADGMRLHFDALVALALTYRILELEQNAKRGVVDGVVCLNDDVNIAAVRIFLRSYEGLLGV